MWKEGCNDKITRREATGPARPQVKVQRGGWELQRRQAIGTVWKEERSREDTICWQQNEETVLSESYLAPHSPCLTLRPVAPPHTQLSALRSHCRPRAARCAAHQNKRAGESSGVEDG